MSSLRETIPLQQAKIIKKSVGGIIGIIILYIFAVPFLVGFVINNPQHNNYKIIIFIGAILFFILFCCAISLYQYFYFQRYFYDIDDKNIIIRKGVLAQKEITLPFSRITDVYVNRDILDVLFGLYDVHMSSPTAQSGEFAHIDGIDKEGSEKIKHLILNKINQYDGLI